MHWMCRKKPQLFSMCGFGKKIKKNPIKIPNFAIWAKKSNSLTFFLIFSETIFCKELSFFYVAFSASGRFFRAIKINYLMIFQFLTIGNTMTSGTTWKHAHKGFVKSVKIVITLVSVYLYLYLLRFFLFVKVQ